LAEQRLTLALAEASSGGALADVLCSVPGASSFFLGGVVAYSNASKIDLLGVPVEVLERHGAVSAEAAAAMAEGARRAFGSALGLAITGILGPGGGTAAKPVGLTYIALARGSATRVKRYVFPYTRNGNKTASVRAAIQMMKVEG
jgi:PncC family amidohydrolase